MSGAAEHPGVPGRCRTVAADAGLWRDRTPLAAATEAAALDRTTLTPGTAVDVALAATPTVRYVIRPSHPGGSVSYGGMLRFTVASAGTYRVAIGSGAWLDVVATVPFAQSSARPRTFFSTCSGIHKMVDFDLKAGTYVLEIAGNGDPRLAVMVARLG